MTQPELHDRQGSAAFYDERYTQGYMEEWPPDKIARLVEVLRGANLPPAGSVLDFGCGNGVLTDILRQALPGWQVYGTDISEVAVQHATQRYPECAFFVSDAEAAASRQFDLVFTNHVLEHVYDLPAILDEIDRYCKPAAWVIHVMPCGNAGSLEYRICQMRHNGIEADSENRFSYEDIGHLRRLTSDQLVAQYDARGFNSVAEYYLNQYYGALSWIRVSGYALICQVTDLKSSKSLINTLQLIYYRSLLLDLFVSYKVARFIREKRRQPKRSLKQSVLMVMLLPFFPLCSLIDSCIERKAMQEWETRQSDRRGSEMSLVFKRDQV